MANYIKRKYEDIIAYCIVCQEFLEQKDEINHNRCARNPENIVRKDENNSFWIQIKKVQGKWIL